MPLCPREWRAAFNPQTQPSRQAADYPSMDELRGMLRSVYSDFCDAAESVDSALLAAPNPYVPSQPDFPTIGHFVPYLLTGHLAYHMGQLRTWRNVYAAKA
jgi:hypothetical protein